MDFKEMFNKTKRVDIMELIEKDNQRSWNE